MALSKDELALLARFGANVRRLRVDAELTQGALAERMGLETRTVQKFEAGEINVPLVTLHRLRRALGCRWDALLGTRSLLEANDRLKRRHIGQGHRGWRAPSA